VASASRKSSRPRAKRSFGDDFVESDRGDGSDEEENGINSEEELIDGSDAESDGGGEFDWIPYELEERDVRMTRSNVQYNPSEYPAFKAQPPPGPNKAAYNASKTLSPQDYWRLFFTDEIIGQFVLATNAYGRKHNKKWEDCTASEFRSFLAVILILGVVQYPNRTLAFSEGVFGNSFIRSVFTLDRFNALVTAWHYEDMTEMTQQERQNAMKSDPFYPVKSFTDIMAQRFMTMYNCGQKIDID
jgi:hypothetical protein